MLAQARALLQGGRFQEAQAALRQVLAREPASADVRLALAQACAGGHDPWGAAAWLSDGLRVAPGRRDLLVALAEQLLALRQFDQALPLYQRLHDEFAARDRATLLHLGFCREHLGDVDGAIAAYRDAVTREPGFLEAHVDLAGVLWRAGDFDGSLAHARAAVNLAPDHPYAVRILGTALLNLNRVEEAEPVLRRALALQPDLPVAQLDLAFTLLLAGRYEEGWAWYARRWNDTARLQRPSYWRAELEWQGPAQPVAGKRVLVYVEQGLGDVLQFARFVPHLQQRGAVVHLAVPPELVALLEHSLPGVQCLRPEQSLQADLHVALLDLPGRLGITLDRLPGPVPYLQPPPARQAAWRERLQAWPGRPRVGLAWSGLLRQVNNPNRAIALSQLQPLLAIPGIQWFSLQKGPGGPWTDRPLPPGMVDLTGEWADFADSAAMLQQLDLVVTVDTSVAHLAGALGVPAWVLLPPNPDFRWLLARDDSPWYPGLRLFRREAGPHGRPVQVEQAAQALRAWLAQRGGAA